MSVVYLYTYLVRLQPVIDLLAYFIVLCKTDCVIDNWIQPNFILHIILLCILTKMYFVFIVFLNTFSSLDFFVFINLLMISSRVDILIFTIFTIYFLGLRRVLREFGECGEKQNSFNFVASYAPHCGGTA